MSPEELAEARHYAACYQAGYVHDLMHNLLDHIDQQAARIAELEAQVAALKEIAVEGWAVAEFGGEQEGQDYYLNFREWNIDRESYRKEALELLQAEHPEAFR